MPFWRWTHEDPPLLPPFGSDRMKSRSFTRGTPNRAGARVLHPLGRPASLHVRTDQEGRPTQVFRRGGKTDAVVAIREVWRIDDEWWRAPVSRLYHEVVLESGRLLTLYQDLLDGSWHEQ